MNVDALDEQLDNPRLLDGEELIPDCRKVGQQDRDLALGDGVVLSLAAAQVRASSSGAASSFCAWSSAAPSTTAAGTLVTAQLPQPCAIVSRVR
jgi:hypothetical protein